MKKRILSAVVVLVLFAGVLAGCISGHGTQEAKLNIIDDNYRNYYEIFVGGLPPEISEWGNPMEFILHYPILNP